MRALIDMRPSAPQVINLEFPALLENVITFPPDGAFVVESEIEAFDPRRSDFIFRRALLKLKNRTLVFPPFGEGWCVPSLRK